MKRMMGGAALVAAAMVLTPPQIDAQQGSRAREGVDRRRGAGIEMLMRMQERLELSEEQMNQLDALRQEAVTRRSAHEAELAELRSQLAAGRLDREAFREQMEARWEGSEAIREQQQERVNALLTEAQRDQLDELQARGRAFRAGRASAMRRGDRSGDRGAYGMRGGGRNDRRAPAMRGHDFRRDRFPDRGRRPFRRGGEDLPTG